MKEIVQRKGSRPSLMKGIVLLFLFLFPFPVFPQDQSFFSEKIQGNKLDTWKKDNKIEHSRLVVNTLLLEAEKSLQKGNQLAALSYAERAVQFSPQSPLPHFFLAHAIPLTSQESLIQLAGEYVTALKLSWSDFRLTSVSLGTAGIAVIVAIFLSILTFLLYVYVLYFHQGIHYVQERLKNRVHPYLMGSVFLLFWAGLFYLLPPFWFLLISLFFPWFFCSQGEKKMTILSLVGLISCSLLLSPFLRWATLTQSPLMDQMIKNQQAEFLWWPIPVPSPEEQDWRIPFVEASYSMQKRDWRGAENLYKQSLLINKNSTLIFNNLGNIYFYQNRLDHALDYYQKAIDISPYNILAHYNMSQVYREQLLFQKGEEKYKQTKAMNPERVKYYSQLATVYPRYPVMEGRFTQKDLWQTGFTHLSSGLDEMIFERVWIGDFSWGWFITLALFSSLGLMGLCLYWAPSISGGACSICFKATCERCQKTFSTYNMCSDCGKDLKTAVSKKRGTLPQRIYPFFILPGGGHLALQKPIRASFFMVLFYFLVALVAFGDLFFSSAHWHLSLQRSPLLWSGLFLFYLLSLYDLFLQQKDRPWHSKGL